MTSDFYFTATSWFPGNVRVKPHSKHSGGGGIYKWGPKIWGEGQVVRAGTTLPPVLDYVFSTENKQKTSAYVIYMNDPYPFF